jgi:hypothetical protein
VGGNARKLQEAAEETDGQLTICNQSRYGMP